MVAVGLAIVALIMTVRMISGSFTSSTPAVSATSAPVTAPPRPARRTKRGARPAAQPNAGAVTPNLDPRLKLNLLTETETLAYEGKGRNIFRANVEDAVVIPKPVAPAIKPNPAPPPQPAVYTPPPPPP